MVKKQIESTSNSSKSKIASIAGAVIIAGAALGGAYVLGQTSVDMPDVESINQSAYAKGVASVPSCEVEVITETDIVEVEVLVDNENLKLVLDTIYDEDGDVEYLLDDLDEDEVDEIVSRIVFKDESISMAEALVKDEIVEFMDDETDMFKDLEDFRDNDVYKVSIDEDDTVFEVEDFEDKEATVFVEARLKLDNDDDKMSIKVIAEVEVEDGELEIVNVELVE